MRKLLILAVLCVFATMFTVACGGDSGGGGSSGGGGGTLPDDLSMSVDVTSSKITVNMSVNMNSVTDAYIDITDKASVDAMSMNPAYYTELLSVYCVPPANITASIKLVFTITSGVIMYNPLESSGLPPTCLASTPGGSNIAPGVVYYLDAAFSNGFSQDEIESVKVITAK